MTLWKWHIALHVATHMCYAIGNRSVIDRWPQSHAQLSSGLHACHSNVGAYHWLHQSYATK